MRRLALLLTAAGGMLVWVACVGSDPAQDPRGSLGHGCNPNGSCLAPLVCVSGVCVQSGGADGGASSDGGVTESCEDLTTKSYGRCRNEQGNLDICSNERNRCCPEQGCASTNDICTAPAAADLGLDCFTSAGCLGEQAGPVCCLTALPRTLPSPVCGVLDRLTIEPTATSRCDEACAEGSAVQLCTEADPTCPLDTICKSVVINLVGTRDDKLWACLPNK